MVSAANAHGLFHGDAFVKRPSHTKITEATKNYLNVFNMPFIEPLCLSVALFLAIA